MWKPSLRNLMEIPSLCKLLNRVFQGDCCGWVSSPAGKPAQKMQVAYRPIVEQLEMRWLLAAGSTLEAISLPVSQPTSATAAGASFSPSVSANGQFVAFESDAANVVPGQTGGDNRNVFLLNRSTGQTVLVSHVAGPGNDTVAPSDGDSWYPLISGNGQYVFYESWASDVVNGMAAGQFPAPNVVLYDRLTDTTTLVSHDNTSLTQATALEANPAAINYDGQYLVFASISTDVVVGQQQGPAQNPNINNWQYFLYNQSNPSATQLITHSTAGLTVTSNGYVGGAASVADNGTVAYVTEANNIVASAVNWDVYVYTINGNNQVIGPLTSGGGGPGLISRDGLTVAYLYAGNVYTYNLQSQVTTLVSAAAGTTSPANNYSGGNYGAGLVLSSATGQYIAFASYATNLVANQSGSGQNLFLYNAANNSVSLISGVDGSATAGAGGVVTQDSNSMPSVSDNGSVAYVSTATNEVANQTSTGPAGTANVFLYAAGQTTLVSGADGSPTAGGDASSSTPELSEDGSLLAFQSQADNLVPLASLDSHRSLGS
jgi:hypothetical protein